ncbi:uncharacterized protein LOC113776538 isoform X2 [Coffea eugenioides]|uniref:uncharacterized protein LOC113776538 isoform X2 n=1 Tax=Coffea eugenioides TaxID=49369 RepID=UPI000F60CE7B|nr:uncharacterized protein LOC113776538 isoform X2 [Coffea eugenioides]
MDIVTARETKEVAMGRKSSRILIAFVVIMLMAIAAYIKIWTIDYRISSQESLLLRQQFDLAHREAMDESAEWRQRFDMEVEKSQMCIKELDQCLPHRSRNLARLRVRLVSTRNWSCWRRKIWTCLNK